MKETSLLAMASACLLAAPAMQANLVINGGFETGDLVPWAPSPVQLSWPDPQPSSTAVLARPDIGSSIVVRSGVAHSGTYAAQLGGAGNTGIGESVATTSGTTYLLDFWARSTSPGTPVDLGISFGTTFSALIAGTPAAWTEYSYRVTASDSTSLLLFNVFGPWRNSALLDDVRLTPVPEPTTIIAGAMLLLPFGTSTWWIIRRQYTR